MGQVATHMWLSWSHLCRSDVFGALTFDFQDDLNTASTTMSLFGLRFTIAFVVKDGGSGVWSHLKRLYKLRWVWSDIRQSGFGEGSQLKSLT